jgi:hypothetical protein
MQLTRINHAFHEINALPAAAHLRQHKELLSLSVG